MFTAALLKKVKPLSKNATEQMDTLAKESKGGEDVDAQLSTIGDEGTKKKSTSGSNEGEEVTISESTGTDKKKSATSSKEGEEVTITESSGADDKKTTKPVQKVPQGKGGQQQNKTDLSHADFIPIDEDLFLPIIEEYGLTPEFPKEQFMVRRSSEAKILYFITKSIKEDLFDHGIQERVTVINSGLKGFERCSLKQDNKSYRLAQEGIQYIVPYMTKRIVNVKMDDFAVCVRDGFTPFRAFSESLQKELEHLTPGSFLVTLEGYEKDFSKKMYLVMWRRSNCLECFVAKIEKDGILMKMRALGHVPRAEDEDGEAVNSAEKDEKPAVTVCVDQEKDENGKADNNNTADIPETPAV